MVVGERARLFIELSVQDSLLVDGQNIIQSPLVVLVLAAFATPPIVALTRFKERFTKDTFFHFYWLLGAGFRCRHSCKVFVTKNILGNTILTQFLI